jgi:hypothetical protein
MRRIVWAARPLAITRLHLDRLAHALTDPGGLQRRALAHEDARPKRQPRDHRGQDDPARTDFPAVIRKKSGQLSAGTYPLTRH